MLQTPLLNKQSITQSPILIQLSSDSSTQHFKSFTKVLTLILTLPSSLSLWGFFIWNYVSSCYMKTDCKLFYLWILELCFHSNNFSFLKFDCSVEISLDLFYQIRYYGALISSDSFSVHTELWNPELLNYVEHWTTNN